MTPGLVPVIRDRAQRPRAERAPARSAIAGFALVAH
eukprot:CAMPEP_0113726566 /NCGR_PEP_ID=MMETSP0038_2-20120614/40533_1 /TAXON_ID=2898 /ORGANISM="Cryptomonas paramecium" /LENGTH=35 /DNA_ID=CAMNT_0000657247 /DNA_START=32 /DNA_END=139 /DNA_ORIENTATION=- /assembly_acc=CAM_ASM_000170